MKKTELKAPSQKELNRALDDKKLELGFLGKFFGGQETAKYNIAGFVLLILIISSIIYAFSNPANFIEMWKNIIPLITLIFGYLFGKNEK